MVIFVLKTVNFRLNFHDNSKNENRKTRGCILAWEAFCNGGAFVLGGLLSDGLFAGCLLLVDICPRGLVLGRLLSGWLLSEGFLSVAFDRLPYFCFQEPD